jgi:hypothetical protein
MKYSAYMSVVGNVGGRQGKINHMKRQKMKATQVEKKGGK